LTEDSRPLAVLAKPPLTEENPPLAVLPEPATNEKPAGRVAGTGEERADAFVGLCTAEHEVVGAGLFSRKLVIADDKVPRAVHGFLFPFAVDDLDVHARELDRRF